MEQWSVAHRNFQLLCAQMWDKPEDCEIILNDIGVTSIRIRMNEPSVARWLSIMTELMRMNDGSMARLVVALMKQYPDNKTLRDVCAPWIPATPAKANPGKSDLDSTIPPGAVLVKKFEDEPIPEPEPEIAIKPETVPKPGPKLVPVTVPEDFAADAALVVPRIDTLWEAMVEMNKRLDDLDQWRDLFARPTPPAKKKGG